MRSKDDVPDSWLWWERWRENPVAVGWREQKHVLRGVTALGKASKNNPNPTEPNPVQSSPTQPRPTLGTNEPTQRGLYSFCFPSIRYTQGKQEGIRMGPDRHLVCWEISLGWSERLPSPLPAPAHQMWGEGHIASALCSVVCVRFLSVFPTLDGTDIFDPCPISVWEYIHLYTSTG